MESPCARHDGGQVAFKPECALHEDPAQERLAGHQLHAEPPGGGHGHTLLAKQPVRRRRR